MRQEEAPNSQTTQDLMRPLSLEEAAFFWNTLTPPQRSLFILEWAKLPMGTDPVRLRLYIHLTWEQMPMNGLTSGIKKRIIQSGRPFQARLEIKTPQ